MGTQTRTIFLEEKKNKLIPNILVSSTLTRGVALHDGFSIAVLKTFAKYRDKRQQPRPFSHTRYLQMYLKRSLTQVFFGTFCKTFHNIFFMEHLEVWALLWIAFSRLIKERGEIPELFKWKHLIRLYMTRSHGVLDIIWISLVSSF